MRKVRAIVLSLMVLATVLTGCSGSATNSGSVNPDPTAGNSFAIEGKWKNVGEATFGQAQKGSIVAFDGKNCNFFSPQDTYAFYKDGDTYRLDTTSLLFSQNLSFTVNIVDANNIEINTGGGVVVMTRVG